jgi:hypothetical protein
MIISNRRPLIASIIRLYAMKLSYVYINLEYSIRLLLMEQLHKLLKTNESNSSYPISFPEKNSSRGIPNEMKSRIVRNVIVEQWYYQTLLERFVFATMNNSQSDCPAMHTFPMVLSCV